jgi:glycosyltransferase involved in cell wall biosynthesis
MRIIEAVSQLGRNGAIVYARQIIPMLQARGHDVWLAAPPDSWIAAELAGQVPRVPTTFARWPLGELDRMAAFCRQEKIDLVHSHLTRAANFCALLRVRHGIASVAHAHSNHAQPHWYFHNLIIAASAATLRQHQRRLAARWPQGAVLHNFVDAKKFAPHAEASSYDPLRAAFGIAREAPVVLQVGAIDPRKGQQITLQAAARLRRDWPSARFVFIGPDGGGLAHGPALRGSALATELKAVVHWSGAREDVAQLLPWATVAVLPSLDEPFTLAGLEAMACGVPLVASNVGGFPEMIEDGVSGVLVPPGDDAALAQAVGELLADPERRAALGAAARARVLAEFAPEPHLARLEKLLAGVARRGQRA